jgi:hypothetical protein
VLVYTRLSPWHSCQQEKITHGKTIALHSAAITVHKINAHNGSRMSARMQKPLNAAYHLKRSQRNKRHVVIGHTRHVDYLITSTSTPLCTMLATRAEPDALHIHGCRDASLCIPGCGMCYGHTQQTLRHANCSLLPCKPLTRLRLLRTEVITAQSQYQNLGFVLDAYKLQIPGLQLENLQYLVLHGQRAPPSRTH